MTTDTFDSLLFVLGVLFCLVWVAILAVVIRNTLESRRRYLDAVGDDGDLP